MNASARLWSGGLLAAAGVVCWALTLAIFEPEVVAGGDMVVDLWSLRRQAPGDGALSQMLLWPIDLRWGAMMMALGGLLIAVNARVPIVLTIPVWLALDLTADQADVAGWPAFAGLAGGVAVILGVGVSMAKGVGLSGGAATPRTGPGILVYCGVAAALSPLMFSVDPATRPFRPQAMMVVAILLSLGLAVSAALAALTASRPSGDRGIVVALGIAFVVAAPAIAVQWWWAEVDNPGDWVLALPWAAAPILLLGCVLLAKGRPATGLGWIGTGFQAVVVSGLSFGLIWFGLVLSLLIRTEYLDRAEDTYQIVVGGLVAGPFIGVVAMLGGRSPLRRTARRPVRSGRDAAFMGEG